MKKSNPKLELHRDAASVLLAIHDENRALSFELQRLISLADLGHTMAMLIAFHDVLSRGKLPPPRVTEEFQECAMECLERLGLLVPDMSLMAKSIRRASKAKRGGAHRPKKERRG